MKKIRVLVAVDFPVAPSKQILKFKESSEEEEVLQPGIESWYAFKLHWIFLVESNDNKFYYCA